MPDVVHPDAEALLAGKKCLHVLYAHRRNAEQMISIGASHNTCHLFLGEITVERKGRSIQGETGPMDIGREAPDPKCHTSFSAPCSPRTKRCPPRIKDGCARTNRPEELRRCEGSFRGSSGRLHYRSLCTGGC